MKRTPSAIVEIYSHYGRGGVCTLSCNTQTVLQYQQIKVCYLYGQKVSDLLNLLISRIVFDLLAIGTARIGRSGVKGGPYD